MTDYREGLEKCPYLMPFRDWGLVNMFEDIPECLLDERHDGEHLVLLSDGRYVVWEYDHECGCPLDELEECECFLWGEVTPDEAQRLISGRDIHDTDA